MAATFRIITVSVVPSSADLAFKYCFSAQKLLMEQLRWRSQAPLAWDHLTRKSRRAAAREAVNPAHGTQAEGQRAQCNSAASCSPAGHRGADPRGAEMTTSSKLCSLFVPVYLVSYTFHLCMCASKGPASWFILVENCNCFKTHFCMTA